MAATDPSARPETRSRDLGSAPAGVISAAMDVRGLTARLLEHPANIVVTFEGGRVVQRAQTELHDDVLRVREALRSWGVEPGMRVGIRAPNSYAWLVHDLALLDVKAVSVPFTEDFAAASATELCDRYELSLLLASRDECAAAGVAHVAALEGDNHGVRVRPAGAAPDDPGFDTPWLIFSSGSAGGIKGMVLNRRGVEANVDAFTRALAPRTDDRALLFLPLSNFQQRLIYYAAIWHGFDVILTDPNRLFRALKELRPTTLIAPPMFYEAFETRFSNLPSWKRIAARVLGEVARRVPTAGARARLARAVFADAYRAFGGQMRVMITGMAPIKRSTLDLFALMQLPLYETYGLSECGSVSLNLPSAHRIGSVGRLLPGIEVELADDGEIIVRREHATTRGYFACSEGEHEQTFISDHRVATGDIGRFDDDGYLYLVGRKKEIIITRGGEKIHPEAIEAEIDACPDVAKSVVLGGGDLTTLVAVVVPREPGDPAARARIERFVEGVEGRRTAVSVGRVIFTDTAFTRENGFLRPNLKLDRRRIREHFIRDGASADTPRA